MEINKFPMLIVGVVVALVLAGAVIPGFVSASEMAGDEITKFNEGTGRTFKEMVSGDVLKCVSTYNGTARADTWTLNDKSILNEGIQDLTWDWFLISDVCYAQVFAPSNSSVGAIYSITTTGATDPTWLGGATVEHPIRTYTFEMDSEKKIHYSFSQEGSETVTAEYTAEWAYVISALEDGAYMSAQITSNSYYARYGDKNIILAGNYTTGELDTGYYYGKNGVLTVVNTNYTGTVNFNQALSDDTTDIYDTLITVTVTDGSSSESFSPYRALVPYKVEGHADNGALYVMLQILPVLVIAGLVIGTTTWFISKK